MHWTGDGRRGYPQPKYSPRPIECDSEPHLPATPTLPTACSMPKVRVGAPRDAFTSGAPRDAFTSQARRWSGLATATPRSLNGETLPPTPSPSLLPGHRPLRMLRAARRCTCYSSDPSTRPKVRAAVPRNGFASETHSVVRAGDCKSSESKGGNSASDSDPQKKPLSTPGTIPPNALPR